MDFTEGRVAIPSAHGISNFLKRRHSVPETQHELRNMNANGAHNKKPTQGLIERLFSRRKSKTVVGVALPAA